jgi:hypothetical protein
MSRLRFALVAVLVASTAVFAVGVIAERSQADRHAEPAGAQTRHSGESAAEPAGAHREGGGETAGAHEPQTGTADEHAGEKLLGVDIESTPMIVLAVLAGLGLAALAATQAGRLPATLLVLALIAAGWGALDVREVVHQLDESRTAIAIVAIVAAGLHLTAAALAGLLAMRARQADVGAPGRAGTMPV